MRHRDRGGRDRRARTAAARRPSGGRLHRRVPARGDPPTSWAKVWSDSTLRWRWLRSTYCGSRGRRRGPPGRTAGRPPSRSTARRRCRCRSPRSTRPVSVDTTSARTDQLGARVVPGLSVMTAVTANEPRMLATRTATNAAGHPPGSIRARHPTRGGTRAAPLTVSSAKSDRLNASLPRWLAPVEDKGETGADQSAEQEAERAGEHQPDGQRDVAERDRVGFVTRTRRTTMTSEIADRSAITTHDRRTGASTRSIVRTTTSISTTAGRRQRGAEHR